MNKKLGKFTKQVKKTTRYYTKKSIFPLTKTLKNEGWAIIWNIDLPFAKEGEVVSLHTVQPLVSNNLWRVVPITYQLSTKKK